MRIGYVWRLDRLGRSLGDFIRLTQDLQRRGIAFAFLRSGDVPISPIAEQFRVARSTLYRSVATAA